MNIKPLFDRVVLKKIEPAEETTASGLILPDSAKEKPEYAEVVAVGPGIEGDDGVKMVVNIGDRVIVSKYAGTEVKIDDVEYTILRQDDILALVE